MLKPANNVSAKNYSQGSDQSQHHHERVVLCETRLRGAEERRHQTHYKGGDRVNNPVDEILIRETSHAARESGKPRTAIDGAIYYFRVKSVDAAGRIHHSPCNCPAVELIDPVLVITGLVERAQPRGPDLRQARVF